MAEETNLAEILSKVLERLAKQLPSSPSTGIALAVCWAATLGKSGAGPLTEVENVARIASLLNKLKAQVQASSWCTGAAKTWAMATLGSFDDLFSFPHLMQNGHTFRGHVDVNKLGALQGVGHALQSEYPEVVIAEQEARKLSDTLTEIVKDVNSSLLIPLNLPRKLHPTGASHSVVVSQSRFGQSPAPSRKFRFHNDGCTPDRGGCPGSRSGGGSRGHWGLQQDKWLCESGSNIRQIRPRGRSSGGRIGPRRARVIRD